MKSYRKELWFKVPTRNEIVDEPTRLHPVVPVCAESVSPRSAETVIFKDPTDVSNSRSTSVEFDGIGGTVGHGDPAIRKWGQVHS